MRKQDEVRRLEIALVEFCKENNIVLKAGYRDAGSRNIPMVQVERENENKRWDDKLFELYEVCSKGLKRWNQYSRYSRRTKWQT